MQKRIIQMDMARGLAIIGVLLIHITGYSIPDTRTQSVTGIILVFLNQISRFSVPVFILLSGMGLSLSNKQSEKYVEFIWNRIKKILPSFIFWSVVYLIYSGAYRNFLAIAHGDLKLIFSLVRTIMGGYCYYHLYFIPIIFQMYFIFPFIYRYFSFNFAILLSLAINALVLIVSYYFSPSSYWISLLTSRNSILNWIFYFVFGVWIAKRIDKWQNLNSFFNLSLKDTIKSTFILPSLLITIESYIYLINDKSLDLSVSFKRPTIIIYTLVFWIFISTYDWSSSLLFKPLMYLSKISFNMFLSHALVLDIFSRVYIKLGLRMGSLMFLISSFICVMIICIIINLLINNLYRLINKIKLVSINQ